SLRLRFLVNTWLAILKVDVPDSILELLVAPKRVTAAKPKMAGVKAESDYGRISPAQQLFDLPGRFDESGCVMMEHTSEPRFPADSLRDSVHTLAETLPTGFRKTLVWCDPPSVLGSNRIFSIVVGQYNKWSCSACLGHQSSGSDRDFFA